MLEMSAFSVNTG